MNEQLHDSFLQVLCRELIPALGCTEPIAIAYAAAKARQILDLEPEGIRLRCSGNIIKNVKGVAVPNAGGLKGVEAAAILGAIGGDADRELEVLQAVTPAECLKKTGLTREKITYSLIIGKNRFNFYKSSGISQGSCGRMVTEYNLNLPGGFPLPVKLLRHSHIFAATEPAALDETLVAELLTEFAQGYLAQQMIAGTVAEAMETIWVAEDRWILTGNYACTEMIGREQAEQNGELHETSGTDRQRGPGG